MSGLTFMIEGLPFAVVPGRKVPGLPDLRVIRTDTKAHVSLAYQDGAGYLFDDRRAGYRVSADGSVTPFKVKRDYYQARERAGYPVRRARR